ncbi:helix-turn-helix transcriptional regulator [Dietzia aurantiaca]|uniref:helix-turn-helix transcriptional regulator n=1 Tax=Dietzia aurantiaca TaxID=983873 RepID=UPI0027E2DF8F|nr:helix-turn-helix domain-containing protein [Dietzia aurantiaca]
MTGLLTPQELAGELGMAVTALAQWRYRGQGPRFIKEGRWVRYRRSDVDAWIADRVHDRTDRPITAGGRRAS